MKKFVAIGAGGVGFWTALAVVLQHRSEEFELHVFDSDNLSESNLNRIPVSRESVGMKKTAMLRDFLTPLAPDVVFAAHENFTSNDFPVLEHADCVFVCTDERVISFQISEYCRAHGIKHVRATYNTHQIQIRDFSSDPAQENSWEGVPEPERQYGLPSSWASPAMIAGALALYSAQEGHYEIAHVDLRRLDATRRRNRRNERSEDNE